VLTHRLASAAAGVVTITFVAAPIAAARPSPNPRASHVPARFSNAI
jgi:hypothetical protein